MSDEELKVQDAIVNSLIEHYKAVINQYKIEIEQLKNISSVNPQEPKTGHWILLDECSNSGYYCSECHKKVVKEGWSNTVKKIKYCPHCGCRMIEPQESEDENDGR